MALTIGAIASVIGAGSSLLGTLGKDDSQQRRQNDIAGASLQNDINNQAYQQAIEQLINQRSVAGYSDSFGSSYRYDPTTNSWVTSLGALPKAAQTASDQATIQRNTTDLRNAELASQQGLTRAAKAAPAYDTAIRNIQDYRPTTSSELTDLLSRTAVDANQKTYQPLIADTLRSFARTGTAVGPQLDEIGRTQADSLRKSLIDARIAALTNTNQVNAGKQTQLGEAATTAANLSNPALQTSGIATNNPNSALISAISDRAKTAAVAPSYGQGAVNTAAGLSNAASDAYAKSVPSGNTGVTEISEAGKQLAAYFGKGGGGQDAINTIKGWFGSPGIGNPSNLVGGNLPLSSTGTTGNSRIQDWYSANQEGSF